MQKKFQRSWIALAVASTLGGTSTLASAAGFALIEQSASGMGNAFAGAAATAEDASTIFFNPAGMSHIKGSQVVLGVHAIDLSVKFKDGGSTKPAAMVAPPVGGNGGNAGDVAFVPNAYFVMPIGEQMHFGVGVNAPFGLKTEYDDTWAGRFQGIKTDIKTLNINPALSFKVSDALSFGVGANYQKIDTELTNAVVLGLNTEGRVKLKADDDTWGWNAGVLFDAGPSTRIGASYRSKMKYKLEGSVSVTDPTGALIGAFSGDATADLTLPDMFSISLVQKLNDKLDLLADVTFTRWSEIQQVRIINPATGGTRDTLTLNFDDTYRYSLGLNYRYSERFTGKIGVALDQSPVNDTNRTVRLPDNDRKWVSLGGSYMLGASSKLDFGYSHLFVSDTSIDQSRGNAASFGRVIGSYTNSIDIFSVQYSISF